jgi:hypothetical protein
MEPILKIELQLKDADKSSVWPVSVHCHSACNLVVWKTVKVPESNWGEVKKSVARMMDQLADLMHDYQQFAPLVALIELQEDSPKWDQIMGDQDWHRGRFVLQAVKSYKDQSIEQVRDRWLGPLMTSQYTPRRITEDDFISGLNEALDSAKPPQGVDSHLYSRYAANLKSSIDSGQSAKMAHHWQRELLEDINNLLGKSFLEASELD